jgi:SRSO17 transposase
VWTLRAGELAEEWLVIRQEDDQRYSYALSNAPEDIPLDGLAKLKCARHFVERANQDAKSETGWDEFQARKFLSWEHHLAMTIMATWFIAQTKHDWANAHVQDEQLASRMGLDTLPSLSVANVRELLQAVLPLPQLSPEQATRMVVHHLVNRSRSRRSRLKAQRSRGHD